MSLIHLVENRLRWGALLAVATIWLFQKGLEYFPQKQYEQTIEEFQKALQLNPSNDEAQNNLRFVYWELKSYSESEQTLLNLPYAVLSLQGTINKRLDIQMLLFLEPGELHGTYFYKSIGEDIQVQGIRDEKGNLTITEFDKNGIKTGLFTGTWDGKNFSGLWTEPDGTKSMPFLLTNTANGYKHYRSLQPLINNIIKNDPESQYRLATLYHYGQGGLPYNMKEAVKWYLTAAKQGHNKAIYSIGKLYEIGHGVKPDIMETKKLMEIAAKQDYEPAKNWLQIKEREKEDKDINYYINLIEVDPLTAEKELKKINTPTAKAYLAYLYFTNRLAIPNRLETVKKLMEDAIEDIEDDFALGEIAKGKKYEYKNIGTLLTHIRFISGTDKQQIHTPCYLFFQHPKESYKAFNAYWGGNRDNFPLVCLYDGYTELIPEMKHFMTIINEIEAADYNLQGTIRFSHGLSETMDQMMIVVAPQYFLDKKLESDILNKYKDWSKDSQRNKKLYEQLYEAYNNTLKPLADYYFEIFHFTRENANNLSENVLKQILVATSQLLITE